MSILTGWLLLVLTSSFLCSKFFPNEKELSRKVVHIGSGPIIPLAWWLNISSFLAIPLAILITIGLFLNYRFKLLSSIENIERKSFGTIAYGLSTTLLIICFWQNNPDAVTAGVLMMAFGDGFAGLIGQKIKSPYWLVLGQKKSLAGTLTMALTGMIILSTINHAAGLYLNSIDIIAITSLGILLEQISPWGIDNITVPIGVAISWQYIQL